MIFTALLFLLLIFYEEDMSVRLYVIILQHLR